MTRASQRLQEYQRWLERYHKLLQLFHMLWKYGNSEHLQKLSPLFIISSETGFPYQLLTLPFLATPPHTKSNWLSFVFYFPAYQPLAMLITSCFLSISLHWFLWQHTVLIFLLKQQTLLFRLWRLFYQVIICWISSSLGPFYSSRPTTSTST